MIRGLWLVIAAAACTRIPLGDGERRVVARELAADVIVPTLDNVAARATELTLAIERLTGVPDLATLDAAQAAWRAARVPWKEADAFGFGPATELRLGVAIDQWPVDPPKIELELAGTAAFTDAYVETLGANRKGFHAIEYLMFRGDDDTVVIALLTTDALATRRRELLVALAHDLARNAGELRVAWEAYATTLAEPGSGNAAYPTIKSVIDTLANEAVFQSELIADARLGKPMGTASGGTPQPELEESGPSDNSIADMAGALRGIRNIYFGTRTGLPAKGIGQLVAGQSPATDRAAHVALDAALAAVATIPAPYRTALLERRPEIAAAHEAVKELKRVLATEVIGVLGATLKFNDNDGD